MCSGLSTTSTAAVNLTFETFNKKFLNINYMANVQYIAFFFFSFFFSLFFQCFAVEQGPYRHLPLGLQTSEGQPWARPRHHECEWSESGMPLSL